MSNNKKNKRPATSQMNLLLRIILSGYLIYVAFDMRDHLGEPVYTVAMVIFTVVGVALIINSVKRILKGDFDYLDSEGNIIEPDDLDEDDGSDSSSNHSHISHRDNDESDSDSDTADDKGDN